MEAEEKKDKHTVLVFDWFKGHRQPEKAVLYVDGVLFVAKRKEDEVLTSASCGVSSLIAW